MYWDEGPKEVDMAVLTMQSHGDRTHRVVPVEDNFRKVFGWQCSCGVEWLFRLFKFKASGMNSNYRKQMTTTRGRAILCETRFCLCPIDEKLEK